MIIAMQSRLLSDYYENRQNKKHDIFEPRELKAEEKKEKISKNGEIYEQLNDSKD